VRRRGGEITGETGRAMSRGLERFSFLPPVVLLVGVFGGLMGWQFVKHWNPRGEEAFAAQFAVVEDTVAAWAAEEGVRTEVPGQAGWTVKSFGDVDEWHGVVRVEREGAWVEMPLVISFNMRVRGLQPRLE
jgi:hypothetical protein